MHPSGATHAHRAVRAVLCALLAVATFSMPLARVADALGPLGSLDPLSASWLPDAPDAGGGATTPAKTLGAESDKDGSQKTKKVHGPFVASVAAADGLLVAPASRARRERATVRCRSSEPIESRSARAPPHHA